MAQKQGLMVFNSDGNPILDITDRLTKISGEVDIIPADPYDGVSESGTVQCADIVAGMNFWYIFTSIILPQMSEPENYKGIDLPSIQQYSTGYFTWKYPTRPDIKGGVHLVYGVS